MRKARETRSLENDQLHTEEQRLRKLLFDLVAISASCFAFKRIISVFFLIITPPVAINGVTHSAPVVKVELVLY